jgi:hypothetical protein
MRDDASKADTIAKLYRGDIGVLWGGGIFTGEEYIRVIPSPNFPSETHGSPYPSPQDARVRPVRGGRRPVSGLSSVFTLPGVKVALNRHSDGVGLRAVKAAHSLAEDPALPSPGSAVPLPTSLAGGLASIIGAIWGGFEEK